MFEITSGSSDSKPAKNDSFLMEAFSLNQAQSIPCTIPWLTSTTKKPHIFHRQNAAPHRQSDSVLVWVLQQHRSELILDKFMGGGKSIFDYIKQAEF